MSTPNLRKRGHLIEETSDGYWTCKCKSKIYQVRNVKGKFGKEDKREYKEDYMRLEQTVKGKGKSVLLDLFLLNVKKMIG